MLHQFPPPLFTSLTPLPVPADFKLSTEMDSKSWVITVNGRSKVDPHKLSLVQDGTTKWTTLLSERATAVKASKSLIVVSGESGSVSTFTPCGKRLLPPLMTGAPLAMVRIKDMDVIALTSSRLLYVWRMDTLSAAHTGIDLSPILSTKLGGDVLDISITSEGTPIVTMSAGPGGGTLRSCPARVYSYHNRLGSWIELGNAESRAFQLSDFHASSVGSGAGVGIEGDLTDGPLAKAQAALHGQHRSGGQFQSSHATATALLSTSPDAQLGASRDHVVYQIAASVALGSTVEFGEWLLCYARLLARGGLTEELRALCESLLSPSVTSGTAEVWPPLDRFPDLDRAKLLRRCLTAVAAVNRGMQRFVVEYQETLSAVEQVNANKSS